ncbi:unnamed protein product, partial [Adineta steineri]
DMTLDKIKQNTLTSSAQVIAFYDEQLKLNELNLVDESLSLHEHDALLDEKDDLALMNLLLGFPLDDFASTLEGEACEIRSLLNR